MIANSQVRTRWTAVLQRLGAKRAALGATLLNSTVLQLDECVLHIEVPRLGAFQRSQLEKPTNRETVLALVQEEFGLALEICYHAPGEPPRLLEQVRGSADVDALGVALARSIVASPRAARGLLWGLRTEMTLAEIAGERGALNDLLEVHRLLMQLRALAERGETKR
jgi:hypothetical protein